METLGAWLRVWTPPRDVEVPPPPGPRALALVGLALAAVVAVAALVVFPAIDRADDRRQAREQRADERAQAARRARIAREQKPRVARLPPGAGRAAALAVVERAIGRDARARFDPKARTARCAPAPGVDPAAERVAYDCSSVVSDIVGAGEQEGARGALTIPYRAVLDFERSTYALCKTTPIPGERIVPDPRRVVPLEAPCLADS